MTRIRRPSAQTMAVLRALAVDPDHWRYGYDLCAELGLRAGSMYPILIRIADRGLLETSWETGQFPGRPARHLYRLTAAGREYAAWTAPAAARGREPARGQARGVSPGAVPRGTPERRPGQPRLGEA